MRRDARRLGRQLNPDAGYTLVEMLVVIGIIALIAAVLTPQLMSQMSRARAKTAQLQLDTVASAVELFRTDVGRYPTEQEGFRSLVADPGAEGWTGPYLKDARSAKDPWSRDLVYQLEADGQRFVVISYGADGRQGGGGAARDIRAPAADLAGVSP